MKAFNITPEKQVYKVNKSRVFKRAHYLFRNEPWKFKTFSDALKYVYQECREYKAKIEFEFECECNKIRSLYNVEQNINRLIDAAYNRGEKIYVDGY